FEKMRERGYERIGFVTTRSPYRGALFRAGFLFAQSELDEELKLPPLILDETKLPTGRIQKALAHWFDKTKPDAVLTDLPETRELLESIDCRVPKSLGLASASVLDGCADAGICQNPEEIGRVAVLVLVSQ